MMKEVFVEKFWKQPVSHAAVEAAWKAEGFSFGVFRDPPGQEWNDFVHDVDEYVLIAEGELVVDVGSRQQRVQAGDLVQIPKGVHHSLKTVSAEGSVWLYGYGTWKPDA